MSSAKLSTGRRLLFSGILLLLVAFSLELILQLFYFVTVGDWLINRTGLPIFEVDETRCYRVKSNLEFAHRTNEFDVTIYTNGQGMRTDARRLDVSVDKPEGVTRVLLLGPSFAFGWGNEYEDSYGALIGELLRESGVEVEIVNLGTPAQGVEAQLCWLQQEGYRLAPDLVLQTVYGNTIPTVVGTCPEQLSCPVIQDSMLHSTWPTLRSRLIARVKNLATVFYGFYVYHTFRGDDATDRRADDGKELHSERARQSLDAGRDAFVADYHRFLRLVHEAVGPETEVAFLFVPMSYLVHPEDTSRWVHLNDPDPLAARRDVAAAAAVLEAEGFELIDTSAPLIARASEERLYYWLDIHLTPAGNRVVAETAAARLAKLLAGSRVEPAPTAPDSSASP